MENFGVLAVTERGGERAHLWRSIFSAWPFLNRAIFSPARPMERPARLRRKSSLIWNYSGRRAPSATGLRTTPRPRGRVFVRRCPALSAIGRHCPRPPARQSSIGGSFRGTHCGHVWPSCTFSAFSGFFDGHLGHFDGSLPHDARLLAT